ncbi:hypothetical protein Fcan01_22379 [Folsomia candida]|uniref:BEN domain-containing protein n=1 Tax=Folsomia candida TaxID=158441 RepID=A0A226DE59_FOLCA|nr:hypothetical protein Fcan01_22379 [Folsomia candida]
MEVDKFEWVKDIPKQYSVVSLDQLVDNSHRCQPEQTVGKIVQIVWTRGKIYPGLVLKIGDEEGNLSEEADGLAEAAAKNPTNRKTATGGKKKGKKRINEETAVKIDQVLAGIEERERIGNQIEGEPPMEIEENENTNGIVNENASTDNKLVDDYKEKYFALKIKFKRLKVKYRDLKQRIPETNEVELYPESGVTLASSDLASIKMASPKPTILARNLFRRLFSAAELSGHSLQGKKCNANQDKATLPAIDSVRRDAVINFILKEEGFDGPPATGNLAADKIFLKSKNTTRKEIVKSLSEFLREENKKLVNLN